MTSKRTGDKAVPVFGAGKPVSLETVNRTIARVRRERDRDNLGSYSNAPDIPRPAKSRRGTVRRPPRGD